MPNLMRHFKKDIEDEEEGIKTYGKRKKQHPKMKHEYGEMQKDEKKHKGELQEMKYSFMKGKK